MMIDISSGIIYNDLEYLTELQPDLNGALFYGWLSAVEDNNKKSGNGGRKSRPNKN